MNLQRHKSWDTIDSTKLQAYMDCPRKYFYEYILGWRAEAPSIHLEFGKAWHLAMEHLILTFPKERYSDRAVAEAFSLFLNHYRLFFPEELDAEMAPKNPENALKALMQYAQAYKNDEFEPLYTEIAGTVPINPTSGRVVHFRMDSILNTKDGKKSREHKTGSTLSRQWTDQWSLSMQTGVYLHVLNCLYPQEDVWGVEVNGCFFQKKENKFMRVPCRRSRSMMNAWLWNVESWIDSIEGDTSSLIYECTDSEPILTTFPMNSQACTKYFGCPYFDYCLSWPNPLRNLDRVPMGMKVEWWDPAAEESNAKVIFNLER